MLVSNTPRSPLFPLPVLQPNSTPKDLLHLLAHSDLPPIEKQTAADTYLSLHPLSEHHSPYMMVSLLTYASTEKLQKTLTPTILYGLIKEIIINQGVYLDAPDLLQQLFQLESKEKKTERLFSFFLQAAPQEQNLFLACVHSSLRQELNACIEEIMDFLNAPSQIAPIPFKNSQRTYFLHLFFAQALDRPNSFLIAANLTAHDWRVLHDINKESNQIVDRCLYWIEKILPFLEAEQHSEEETKPQEDRTQLFTFFSHASAPFEEESMTAQQLTNLKKIAEEFPLSVLGRYYQSLNALVLEQLPAQKVEHLMSYIHALNLTSRDLLFKNIQDAWYKIAPARGFQSMMTIFFSFDTTPSCVLMQLTIYNSINSCSRSTILDALLTKPQQAIPQLFEWCKHVFLKKTDTLSYSARKLTLHEIQKTIMKRAPQHWEPFINKLTAENICEENISQILFQVIDSPQQQQDFALKQLEYFFLEKIDHNEFTGLVARIREDLQADMPRSIWISKLFETLPSQRWPALFAYFKGDMTYEARDWLPPEEKWLNMAAQTLLEASDIFFQENNIDEMGLKALWGLMQQTKTTTKVIERFCVLSSFNALIPTLEKLGSLIYPVDRTYWHGFLATCIEKTQINKTVFIVDCLFSFMREKEKLGITITTPLEKALCYPPFIKNPQEEIELLKAICRELTLFKFIQNPLIALKVIEIHKSLLTKTNTYFWAFLSEFIRSDGPPDVKIKLLNHIAFHYGPDAFIELMKTPTFQKLSQHISVCYELCTRDILSTMHSQDDTINLKMSWSLLNHFNHNTFYRTLSDIFNHLQSTYWPSIELLFKDLSQLPLASKQELLEKLLTEERYSRLRQNDIPQNKGTEETLREWLQISQDNEVVAIHLKRDQTPIDAAKKRSRERDFDEKHEE